jgi:hypothetical protein
MLFPQLGPQYYEEGHKEILGRMEAFYAESITINQSFWGEADTDQRFYLGDQSLWNDLYGNLPANRRRMFSFNRIMRIVNMIEGYQRRNRKSTICVGVENSDDETADQFTKILMHIASTENVLETISDSFHGALISGMNLLHVWVDYRQDPVSGTIKVDNCPHNYFLIDPYFKKADLSDCNALWKRTYLTKREAISLMPQHAEEILGLYGVDNRDGKFQFAAESYNYGLKNLLTYDEFWYRDHRRQKLLVDTQTGETQEWRSQDEDRLKLFMQAYPQMTMVEQEIPTVKLAVVIQGRVFFDGGYCIDRYPFVPVWAYYEPHCEYFPWRIQGVVRGLRDSQYLYNRRRVIELDILESQINSGWKYKENALINPKDVLLNGQGRGLALKEEAQMTDVEQIIPPSIPPSMIQLSELLAKEISEISGVNEELLGSATDEKAGILSMLRQGAGLTTLQKLFDQLDRSQSLLGKLMIDLIQANYTPGKVNKILEEGRSPTPQFYNKSFGVYNATVEEGLNTATQKQMQFAQMLELREAGVPIPDTLLIDGSTLQNKKKLMEAMEQQSQQAQQMQQQQQQLQMAELQANIELTKARATADQGLGIERLSRVEENKALAEERKHESRKDDEIALLNLVKALKEIDTMDLTHIEQLLRMSSTIGTNTGSASSAGAEDMRHGTQPRPAKKIKRVSNEHK